MRRLPWLRIIVHAVALAPLALLALGWGMGRLGVDPVGEALRRTGRCAILLLLLSLAPTAIRILSGRSEPLRLRRALGLYAFLYAVLHLAILAGPDYGLDPAFLAPALLGRRELLGLLSLLILAALALTSTRGWVRRLGRAWKPLHRTVYVAAALAAAHYLWAAKEVRPGPILYTAVLALLLIVRIPPVARVLARRARRET